jgi:hypothetical protein
MESTGVSWIALFAVLEERLEQMNLKLPEVVSDITGKTGMTIIRALLESAKKRGD